MRILLSVAALSMMFTAPANASADSFNALNPEMSTGFNDMSWSYWGASRKWSSGDNAKRFLAQLRKNCRSKNRYDQQNCAEGMSILKGAYSEYRLRRAVQEVVAD